MKLNIAILEDNSLHYQTLSSFINLWAEKKGHLVQIQHFQKGIDIINFECINSYHLLFSDIELNGNNSECTNDYLNGLNVCSALRNNGFSGDIVFLTAFREYVFDGYNVQAINYLLKPISKEKVIKCLDKFISLHSQDYYCYHKNADIIQIPFNDIITISRVGHDCLIQTNNDFFVERMSLKEYENILPEQFLRCHKSCIVNLRHIISLSGYIIRLSNKTTQTVGRLYINDIRKGIIKISNELFI